MAELFAFLFFILFIATIVLLIKPSLTARGNKAALPRLKIFIYGLLASLAALVMVGLTAPKVDPKKLDVEQFSDDQVKVTQEDGKIVVTPVEQKEKTKDEIGKENTPPFELTDDPKQNVVNAQAHYEKLAEEDKPHFNWPKVDYTKAVAKVDLHNDKAIIKAVGKPVADQEKGTNQNGEPMMSYWFNKDLSNYLQLDLSREFIDVAWNFDAKDQAKATVAFIDGQRITRALLGGQDGSALYENIVKGGKIDELNLEDGTVIKNARCGQSMCRYQVVR
ncbi:hypothetical protein [Acinetobacter sp. FDAARGOS_515]|uniref:hypothetical protein n=1 Tax=Acinetobacter sp. FDAARGOS_515 TaxID=2420307 RepID=UPI000F69122D|nr:hypothetical protein [Acinetobacter sp. FDAARGOS_515]RSC23031.1 hypothetical protein EGS47_09875 [Acinetobacter sp. FDAARGOS_515]